MHSFYFIINHDNQDPLQRDSRVARIKEVSDQQGAYCYIEIYEDITTIQVDIVDYDFAIMFRLSIETPTYEY